MSQTTSVEGGEFPCGQCDRAFTSRPALTMHINRVHSRKVKVPGQGMTREQILERKSAYNKKIRAANIAKGLTSAGTTRQRRAYKRIRPLKSLANLEKGRGLPWSAKRRAKFKRTWAAKGKLNRNHEALTLHEELNKEAIPDPRQFINCCPNCGYNLKAHYLAAGFKTP